MFWQIYQKKMYSGFLSSGNLCVMNHLKLFWPHVASMASVKKCQNSKRFLINFCSIFAEFLTLTLILLLFVFSRSPSTAASTASRVDQPPAYSGQPPSYQQATNNEAITDDLINLGGATGGLSPLNEKSPLIIDSGDPSKSQTVTSGATSVDLLSDKLFAEVMGVSSPASEAATVNPSSSLEKSPSSGLYFKKYINLIWATTMGRIEMRKLKMPADFFANTSHDICRCQGV